MTEPFVFEGGEGAGFNDGEFTSYYNNYDHVAKGLARLPYQFQDSENLKHFIQILLEEVQEVEDCIAEYLRQLGVDEAIGEQLNLLGEDVGIKRTLGMSDLEFRKLVRLKILANTSDGTHADVAEIIKLACETDGIVITPEYPAGFLFISDAPVPTGLEMGIVAESLPLTVKMATSTPFSTNDRFCFFGGTGKGFSSVGYPSGTGGEFRGRKEYS
jgi:hypothetical protein